MSNKDWDDEIENESGLHDPDQFEILEALYLQERTANDQLIERLKQLAQLAADDALRGIRDLLEDGYMYFGERRAWDRPSVDSLVGDVRQLQLFEETVQ